MSDTKQIPVDSSERSAAPAPPLEPTLFADPMVRAMAYISLALVILVLATALGVLATRVGAPTGPRSVAERQLMTAAAQAAGATGEGLSPYVNALIDAGNLPAARVALVQARGSVDATAPAPNLDLAEARLLSRGQEYANAISLADRAIKGFKAEHDALIAKGGAAATAAKIAGYSKAYYDAVLVKAYALVKLNRWKEAVAAFDIYLRQNPTASDILIDRGTAKAQLKDLAGAERDFREALRFVPYDEEAKAGLKKIGLAK